MCDVIQEVLLGGYDLSAAPCCIFSVGTVTLASVLLLLRARSLPLKRAPRFRLGQMELRRAFRTLRTHTRRTTALLNALHCRRTWRAVKEACAGPGGFLRCAPRKKWSHAGMPEITYSKFQSTKAPKHQPLEERRRQRQGTRQSVLPSTHLHVAQVFSQMLSGVQTVLEALLAPPSV